MYVADLRALLHERGLSGSGVKSLLVSRLQQDDEDQVGEGEAMAVQGGDGGGAGVEEESGNTLWRMLKQFAEATRLCRAINMWWRLYFKL